VANIDKRVNTGVSKVLPVRNTMLLGSKKDKYKNVHAAKVKKEVR
jgi:hypothetical protein